MGLINQDSFTFKSGATAQGSYLKVSGPAFMVQDSASPTGYFATTTLETYYDKQARTEGKAPMQIEDLQLPVDPAGVYAVIFGGLKQKFTNCTDVLDLDPDTTETASPTQNTPPASKAATDAQPTPSATDSATPAPTNTSDTAPAANTEAQPTSSSTDTTTPAATA